VTYTPIAVGAPDWGPPVNAAFTSQDSRITVTESTIATNSSSITGLQNASSGLTSAASLGYLGWTHDPALITAGQTGTSGTIYLARINVGTSGTATKLIWGINTAGSGATAGQNFVALFNSSGTRLANIGVDARVTTTGVFNETISVPVTPGFYWAAFLFNATGMPAIYRGGFLNASLVNGQLPVSQARFATAGTTQTSIPASITPSSNVIAMHTFYASLTL